MRPQDLKFTAEQIRKAFPKIKYDVLKSFDAAEAADKKADET
jgi:hypothetical protein